MGKWQLMMALVALTISSATLVGCGSSTAPTPGFGVPAVVRLSPTPTASMNLGDTLQFSATALNGTKGALTTTFVYRSSNPNIVSIADNGLACAGTWDSVATPIICTPGGVGTARITAASSGVDSSSTTVFVHQHVARINITPIAPLKPPFVDPVLNCYTAVAGSTITPQTQLYDAQAFTNDPTGQPTIDISSSVGPFTWSSSQSSVATLTPQNTLGIPNGQVQVTAHTPGMTQLTASIADSSSAPMSFTTCPVQSISLAVNVTGGTTISGAKGTSSSVAATVFDVAGNEIAPTLSWTSSNTAVATASSTGGVASPGVGGAAIIASCVSPTCNINLSPPQSIYPITPVSATYTGTTSTPFTVLVSSTNASCAANVRCTAFVVPISGTPPVAGNGAQLAGVPNSVVFEQSGTTGFLGSQKGLMSATGTTGTPTVTSFPRVTGKILAVSPDGKKVIVSDTQSPVNQVFVFDTAANTPASLLISGATAAAFSPDSTKAFIAAGTKLYVYSTQGAIQTGTLPGAGTDVAFLSNGMFGYVAEGGSGFSYLPTCDNPSQPLSSQIQSGAGAISQIRPLPDGSGFVGLAPPFITFINTTITGAPLPAKASGCPVPFPGGVLTAVNSVTAVDLGAGTFTPIAFLVSSDAQKAYIVIPNNSNIIVYDLISGLKSSLALTGSPNPLSAALAPDGATLYVGASDGKVHFINTISGGDTNQVDVPPSSLCSISSGGPQPNCLPDLVTVRP